jgi:hypothetical protein
MTLGPKAKAQIKNILELRKLLWVLLNFDCVSVYNYLSCLLYNENSDNTFRKEIHNKLDRVIGISNNIA